VKRSPQSGFRLLDLLLVVVILGVPFLVAFPTISRITAHSRVNQAAMVVVHDLLLRVSAPTASRQKSHDSTKDSRLYSDRDPGRAAARPDPGLDPPSLERHDRVPSGQCHHTRGATEQSTLVNPACASRGPA
jgi:hypothetical protein